MLANVLIHSFLLHLFLHAVPAPASSWNFNADPVGSLPAQWQARGGPGRPTYQVKAEPDGNRYLAAVSRNSDVQLGVEVKVRPEESPILSWRWRVLELPRAADERNLKTLDSAASVYAVFGSRRIVAAKPRAGSGVLTGLALTLPNPAPLAAWAAVAASLWPSISTANAIVLASGVGIGSAVWFTLLARWIASLPRDGRLARLLPTIAMVLLIGVALVGVARVVM